MNWPTTYSDSWMASLYLLDQLLIPNELQVGGPSSHVVALIAAMTVAIVLTTWLWRRSEESLGAELAQRHRNEQLTYHRNIALAHFEYQSHNVDGAAAVLDQCDPKFRNGNGTLCINSATSLFGNAVRETPIAWSRRVVESRWRLVGDVPRRWGLEAKTWSNVSTFGM